MTLAASDLGSIGDLAKALGLVQANGDLNGDWINEPGTFLSHVLADDTQRAALISFVDEVLGGSEAVTDPSGLTWLPVFERHEGGEPAIVVYVVLDDHPADHVAIGIGLSVAASDGVADLKVHVPLFRAAKLNHAPPPNPVVLGTAEGVIALDVAVTIGDPSIRKVSLTARVPTGGPAHPTLGVALEGLVLPGASAPRDLTISLDDLAQLEQSFLELVIGLVQAQVSAIGSGPLASLAGLLGLREGGAVPALSVPDLLDHGVTALTAWFEGVISGDGTRAAWLGELAGLVGGSADAEAVTFDLGPARLRIGARVGAGTGGHPVIVPFVSAEIGAPNGDAIASVSADLVSIDLGQHTATALPSCSALAVFGRRGAVGTALLTGDPAVDRLVVGFRLDEAHKPVLHLAAERVTIGGQVHDVVDLSSPEAIAEAAGTVLSAVIDELIGQLGPAGDAVKVLLGLSPPTGFPAVPTLDIPLFLHDPLGAVSGYWDVLLTQHADAVPTVLGVFRDLVADGGQAGIDPTGSGTESDPWRLTIITPVDLLAWIDGGVLTIAIGVRFVVDDLGQRCTRLESRVTVGLVAIDLTGRHASFLPLVAASLGARARGSASAQVDLGSLSFTADQVGIHAGWKPGRGLSVDVLAPNLAIDVHEIAVPVALPVIAADGSVTLDEAGWDALEGLLGALASAAPLGIVSDLADALGWRLRRPGDEVSGARLRLARLQADPVGAVTDWLGVLALDEATDLIRVLRPLARAFTGAASDHGQFGGSGTIDDPWLVGLAGDAGTPALAAWIEPYGPGLADFEPAVPIAVSDDLGGLAAEALSRALDDAAAGDPLIRALVTDRPSRPEGLDALAQRWVGSDGIVIPPPVDVPGVTVHELPDVVGGALADALALDDVIGRTATTVVRVSVGDAPWLAAAPPDRVLRFDAPSLPPEAFTPPTAPVAGEWFVVLADRVGAKLATGDPEGIAGQAARLERALVALGGVDAALAVVATAEAGHAAARAADAVAAVTDLVTLGTPWSTVTLSVIDVAPAAESLRLLAALDQASADAPRSVGLDRARALLATLTSRFASDDPVRDLRPPAAPSPSIRAGLAVHAVFGVLSAGFVQQALTDLVLAGTQARREHVESTPPEPTAARLGVKVPLGLAGTTGVAVGGHVIVELAGVERTDADAIALSGDRAVHVHLELRRSGGWLVGGPDPGRVAGSHHDVDLRWLEADVTVPVRGGPERATARVLLHEPRVFGQSRAVWVVRTTGTSLAADEATPALPEVRVLLSAVAESLGSAASADPRVTAARDALRALGLLDGAGGSVPDALDHLLHDPTAFSADVMADGARRAQLVTALRDLVPGAGGAAPDELTWAVGPCTTTLDLASKRMELHAAGTGAVPWTVAAVVPVGGDVTADPTRRADVQVTLGSAGSTPAGGAELVVSTVPAFGVVGRWHRPGSSPPQMVRVWPDPDIAPIAAGLARLAPAELGRRGLEYLRRLDEDGRPVVDVLLDAFGLLAADPLGDGLRPIRLPVGLITDPLGWFAHAGALGGASGGISAPKLIALFDALKPVLGVAGDPGQWQVASGVFLFADDHGGHARLGVQVATAGLPPIAPADERLDVVVRADLTLVAGQAPQPGVELSVGLHDPPQLGQQAVHVVVDATTGLSVFVRPSSGPDITLYPDPPGLGSVAGAAAHALPFVLNALADETGNDAQGKAGAVVRAIGDAMALRTGVPATFHDAELQAWAADPAGHLAARLPALAVAALGELRDAFGPILPAGVTVTVVGTELQVSFNSVTVGLATNPFAVHLRAAPEGIPGIERAAVEVLVDGTGVTLFDLAVGPMSIDAGDATLRPFARFRVGSNPPGGRRVEIGLGLDDLGTRRLAARWALDGSLTLVAVDGVTELVDAESVALAVVDAVVDIVAGLVIGTDAVAGILSRPCGQATIGDVVDGVLVHKPAADWKPVAGLFDVDLLLGRLQTLALNLVRVAKPKLDLTELTLELVESPANTLGVQLVPKSRYDLGGSDITVSLEFDSSWIEKTPTPDPGLLLRILHVGANPGAFDFTPGLEIDGVGIRIARSSGPLIEISSFSIASVALHAYGEVGVGTGIGGGLQLQFSELAVGTAGASGGNNAVGQGVMKDAGSGSNKLAPKFSPAIAVQKQPTEDVLVTLRAGDPPGPWWLAIQKGFGPVYIEQVGFDAKIEQRHLKSVSLLLDGRVSIFGLTAAVDDLSITFITASDASFFDPSRWAVDLAGFAISSDLGGITLVGGLRKFTEPGGPNQPDTIQYIGMLMARFGVYGLSVFGGYGMGRAADGGEFASFFAFGAVNGPIGGPPAFFLTGIGGGLGINRGLVFPTELGQFGTFPFIQALDPGAQPPSDPMAVLEQYKDTFPIVQGQFWFAAGISFNSFALVDGVAVIAISVGDGFELALLGLARMALPRPQFALVSIELGLICRFSTREGVLWIQAQLTDNSWLLFPEVRLTGGFAFVSWFKGPNSGQFVLTIGGFHPDFHRDGYPVVPRLGFNVDLFGAITIKGESYFALTSEALMAGGKLEASAELGPAWAHVVFGADVIVFFDPFWLDARVYASISAGITIDLWFAEVTISIHIGAQIHVSGPKFHGDVTFEIGPVELTVSFGDDGSEPHYIDFPTFVQKYLEEAPGGAARALSSITGRGALTPGPGSGGPKDVATPDGSDAKPFIVISEFELSVTTTVPIVEVRADGVASARNNPSQALGVAPMGKPKIEPGLRLRLFDRNGVDHLPILFTEAGQPRISLSLRNTGAFPVAVWGLPQNKDAKKVPGGDVINATEGLTLDFHAKIEPALPPMKYEQVETNTRRPLPFVKPQVRTSLLADAGLLAGLVPDEPVLDAALHVMPKAGNSVTAMAALALDRAAPPRLGSLTEGLAPAGTDLGDLPPSDPVVPAAVDHRVLAPGAIAILTSALDQPERLAKGTTVSDAPDAPRRAAPSLTGAQAATDLAVPSVLRRIPAAAVVQDKTMLVTAASPLTRASRGPVAAVARRGAAADGLDRLGALTQSLIAPTGDRRRRRGPAPRAAAAAVAAGTILAGEVAVLQLPNARRDAAPGERPTLDVGGEARVVVLSHGGEVLSDDLRPQSVEIAPGAERIVVVGLGDREADSAGGLLSGWHAGQQLALVGWNVAVGSRCNLMSEGVTVVARRQRCEAGWASGAELVRGTTTVTTRFTDRPGAVAVILDQPAGAETGQGLAMTLGGADRLTDADGVAVPPTVVAGGVRSAVIYTIVPQDGPVTVTVASEDAWHLVGVLGGPDAVTVTDLIAGRGVAGAVRPMTAGGGQVVLRWNGDHADPEPPVRPPGMPVLRAVAKKTGPRKAPAKKAAAKKSIAKKVPAKKVPAKKAAAKKAPARTSTSRRKR